LYLLRGLNEENIENTDINHKLKTGW